MNTSLNGKNMTPRAELATGMHIVLRRCNMEFVYCPKRDKYFNKKDYKADESYKEKKEFTVEDMKWIMDHQQRNFAMMQNQIALEQSQRDSGNWLLQGLMILNCFGRR
jgi:hypothetical protein